MSAQRALLVDAEPRRSKTYAGALTSAGFEVIAATSATRALEVLARQTVDVVVTHLVGHGSESIDLVQALSERTASTPIIVMLEACNNALIRRGLQAGASHWLVKPDGGLLKETVLGALKHYRTWGENEESKPRRVRSDDLSVTSTRAQNAFGELLEKVIEGRRVIVTKHGSPKAAVLPYAEFKELTERGERQLDTLSAEFDALLEGMQAPAARAGMKAAFAASPAQLGKAAVAAARKRG